jgi:hypothetical protein
MARPGRGEEEVLRQARGQAGRGPVQQPEGRAYGSFGVHGFLPGPRLIERSCFSMGAIDGVDACVTAFACS